MAKAKAKSKTDLKEMCDKCGSKDFAIDEGIRQSRHCLKCHFVWLPMTPTEMKMQQYKHKYGQALDFAKSVNSQLSSLITEIEMLEDDMSLSKITELVKTLNKESEIICARSLNM